jgi:hypothetical protein
VAAAGANPPNLAAAVQHHQVSVHRFDRQASRLTVCPETIEQRGRRHRFAAVSQRVEQLLA